MGLLFSLSTLIGYGQYSKNGIVEVPNMKSEQIYPQVKEWFFTMFKSAKAVIEVDVPNQKVMGKGNTYINLESKMGKQIIPFQVPMDIIINVDIKDGKYRYNIETTMGYTTNPESAVQRAEYLTDSILKVTPGSYLLGKKFREDMKENTYNTVIQTTTQIKQTIDGLELLLKSSIKEKKDNW